MNKTAKPSDRVVARRIKNVSKAALKKLVALRGGPQLGPSCCITNRPPTN